MISKNEKNMAGGTIIVWSYGIHGERERECVCVRREKIDAIRLPICVTT
jgi:hypothetical protein